MSSVPYLRSLFEKVSVFSIPQLYNTYFLSEGNTISKTKFGSSSFRHILSFVLDTFLRLIQQGGVASLEEVWLKCDNVCKNTGVPKILVCQHFGVELLRKVSQQIIATKRQVKIIKQH